MWHIQWLCHKCLLPLVCEHVQENAQAMAYHGMQGSCMYVCTHCMCCLTWSQRCCIKPLMTAFQQCLGFKFKYDFPSIDWYQPPKHSNYTSFSPVLYVLGNMQKLRCRSSSCWSLKVTNLVSVDHNLSLSWSDNWNPDSEFGLPPLCYSYPSAWNIQLWGPVVQISWHPALHDPHKLRHDLLGLQQSSFFHTHTKCILTPSFFAQGSDLYFVLLSW